MLVLSVYINGVLSEVWDGEAFVNVGKPIDLIDGLPVFFEHHSRPNQEIVMRFSEVSERQYHRLLDEWREATPELPEA